MPAIMNWSPARFFIPPLLANWPWPRLVNPSYEESKAASTAWCNKYISFSERMHSAVNTCNLSLLASMSYANSPADVNRVGCDLMNIFFFLDDLTDAMDPTAIAKSNVLIIDALHHPHKPRPFGENPVGDLVRTYWERAIKSLGPTAQRHFLEAFIAFLQGLVDQAQDREGNVFRNMNSYMDVRRATIGALPCFALLEHDMELPDEVFHHPILKNLRVLAVDMIIFANDLCSFNVEQARGEDSHNSVRLLMVQEDTDIQGAINVASKMHDDAVVHFLSSYQRMPSYGEPIDEWVVRYIDGLANWVRANYQWSFETWRYFKDDGLRVLVDGWVDLLPPSHGRDGDSV